MWKADLMADRSFERAWQPCNNWEPMEHSSCCLQHHLLLLIYDLGDFLRHPQCKNILSVSHESKKEYLASVPFYQQLKKKHLSKIPCPMAGARLMKLKTWSIISQQIARKASYTQMSGIFSQIQSFTGKFVLGWSDLEDFLVTPALLFWQSHSWLLARPSKVWHTAPSGGLGLLSSEWPNEVRDLYCQHVPPAEKPQKGSDQDFVQSNTIAPENTQVLKLVVSQHTAKIWSTMSY